MCLSEEESTTFYKYLCQKIGTPKIVHTRRLMFAVADILNAPHNWVTFISSGSKAEGLDLSGSDIDVMHLHYDKTVYENMSDAKGDRHKAQNVTLVMETEETKPCFTRLRMLNYRCSSPGSQTIYLGSADYREAILSALNTHNGGFKIHGPCVTSGSEELDIAVCFRCEKWISDAQPWLYRARSSWPPSEVISKIISFGVLFVPIGCKGSPYEHLEWRISFSFAEKLMIFSFNHTQLLCYALMKILLKELIESNIDLKGLLCSYFIKTLLFWMFEESDQSSWRPDNIIPCFMACLKRLVYSVEYRILLHFFIPENNLLENRFSDSQKASMVAYIRSLYQYGWQCFGITETLKNCQDIFSMTLCSLNDFTWLVRLLNNHYVIDEYNPRNAGCFCLLPKIAQHCHSPRILKEICYFHMARGYQSVVFALKYQESNKISYIERRFVEMMTLLGCSTDAVSGWLQLASYFYCFKSYNISLDLIRYSLSKCTDDKIYWAPLQTVVNHQSVIWKGRGILSFIRSLMVKGVSFFPNESLIPEELESEINKGPNQIPYHIPPVVFGHFLTCLCYYHLGRKRPFLESLNKLEQTCTSFFLKERVFVLDLSISLYCLWILYQIIGDRVKAREAYKSFIKFEEMKRKMFASWFPMCGRQYTIPRINTVV